MEDGVFILYSNLILTIINSHTCISSNIPYMLITYNSLFII